MSAHGYATHAKADGMLPLPETFVPAHLAADFTMSLDRWEWLKNRVSTISDVPQEGNCGICRNPLDPTNEEMLLMMAENTPENRKLISPHACKSCKCTYHVGCLKANMDYSPLDPYCRGELGKSEGAFRTFNALCNGMQVGTPFSAAPLEIDGETLACHVAMAAFAIQTTKDKPVQALITHLIFDGEECPVFGDQYPLRIITTQQGRDTAEAMVRTAFVADGKSHSLSTLKWFLEYGARQILVTGLDGQWPWFAGLLADMAAQAYVYTKKHFVKT